MRKRFKVVVAALAVSLLAATPLGQKMDMSSVAYAYVSDDNSEIDTKSGLLRYWDSNLGKYGYTDSSGNIVIPARWERADRFYAGYTIVVEDRKGVYFNNYSGNTCRYDFINEQGTVVTSFEWTVSSNKSGAAIGNEASTNIVLYRFVENSQNLMGYIWGPSNEGYVYSTFTTDGQINRYTYPEFEQKVENNILIKYQLGTFRNGSANIYKYTGKYILDINEGSKSQYQTIGSITVNGEFSTDINPDSKREEEQYPQYGTQQFTGSATTVTEGWKQDGTGWWYQNADGSYPVNQWREVNGKQYYFGADGYMLADTTTPDGYSVGADGAWIE